MLWVRDRVGAAPVIAPHQAVVLEGAPDRARAVARAGLAMFIGFPAYRANLCRLGFTDEDLVPGGSDPLIDAVTAWGDLDDVARRIQEHLDAGGPRHLARVLDSDPQDGSSKSPGMPRQQWRAPAALLPGFARA